MTRLDIRKVLLVDPDPALRHDLRGHLEHHGYLVEAADNAVDAIRLGLVLMPHVLVIGSRLADEASGVRVVEALERHVAGLEVILITGEPFEQVLDLFEHVRIAEVVALPVPIEHLFDLAEAGFARARDALARHSDERISDGGGTHA